MNAKIFLHTQFIFGDVPKWLKGPHSKWSSRLFVLSARKPSSDAGLSQFKKVNILLFCPQYFSEFQA